MPIEITGLKDILAELRVIEDASPREVTAALKKGAVIVAARANELAPRGKTGKLSANGRPYATQKSAGVRYTSVYAPVQEFATTWQRRARGGSVKTETVHYTKNGRTPRFAFKAVEELADELVQSTFDALCEVLKAHGWFSG